MDAMKAAAATGLIEMLFVPDKFRREEVGYKGLYSIENGRNNGPDPYAAVHLFSTHY